MKRILTCSIIFLLIAHCSLLKVSAQDTEKKEKPFGISFSGYVDCDVFFDSRQTVNSRDGQFLMYPENVKPDADGKDINAQGTFNILSIQTRLTGTITGPDIFKARTSGVIEGEFYGNINPNINTLRLRLAFVKFAWTSTELTLGQNWHPMYVPGCMPEVISLNSGAPFLVFSRNPQLRIAQSFGGFKIQFAAISQVDGTSNGPDGPSPKYLRNSILPELNILVQYCKKNEEMKREFIIGASFDYLMLTPRLSTEIVLTPAIDTVINNVVYHHDAVVENYRTNAKSYGLAGSVYAKMKLKPVTLRIGAVYGTDCYAFNMLGGYAVKSITDPGKGFVDYGPMRTGSAWIDFKTNGEHWQPGLFLGYSKNFGSTGDISGPYYARGCNISYLYRVSPRLAYRISKVKIASELEYTVAAYGTNTSTGSVKNANEVGNWRILLGVFYYF
jgi:hypothetical protein